MINLVLWLVIGGTIGWLAGRVLGTNAERWSMFNIAVGMAGAVVGGMLFGGATISSRSLFSEGALMISFLGAVISSALVNFFRRSVVQ